MTDETHPDSETGIAALKDALRREGFTRRDALDAGWRMEASRRIAASVLALPDLADLEPVGAYWPMRSEVDPRPTLAALAGRGCAVALSQTRMPTLVWRAWKPGDRLAHGGFGVMEPGPDAAEVSPRALLVPLCRFDRTGGRIGYGKGHFDRSITALSALHPLLTIGIAFSVQEADAVPMASHDRPLDLVVTEREVIRARESVR
ncbi:5-formyltetrahydrofolate cyclo-ligase [Enterovirga rhinocerotis]|uniref:5-formyltetrahydrofolate cyclo-ligase n=1 Tax=Enterovirga rhinocerotis TaxID=1339210 RepID=A0A4R7BYI8_9HYPH|nr:5-formyltetrahydrofolate cyclo-ligase [Enterovirga rhinocerotis]TDR89815.1 5-formyltetrahydrofolate cyclo-ligase [Enterovirga rhinocerotis]